MHSVCCCSLLVWRRSFLKKGTPFDLFLPRPGSAPGRIWPKNNNTCKGPWVLHTYQVSSKSIKWFWRRSRKCKLSNGRQTSDDGRQTQYHNKITIGHWSLWLLCPKKRRKLFYWRLNVKILQIHQTWINSLYAYHHLLCYNCTFHSITNIYTPIAFACNEE